MKICWMPPGSLCSLPGSTKYGLPFCYVRAGIVSLLALIIFSGCAQPLSGDEHTGRSMPIKIPSVNLVPQPQSLQINPGFLQLGDFLGIRYENPLLTFSAQQLKQAVTQLSNVQVSESASSNAVLEIDNELAVDTYKLQIDKQGIQIVAGSEQGVFYGVQTLRQLIFQFATDSGMIDLPHLIIEDYPRFRYRGMHLDVSRHFFDINFIKKYLDLIALHKMNYFHWHLTDDQGWRIEIDNYPRLTEVGSTRPATVVGHTHQADAELDGVEHGGFYTQQDIREIVAYAAQRHITVIPEIDVPGHASAIIAAYPQFGCGQRTEVKSHFGIFKNALCPSEETFAFLDDLFSQVATLFPGNYIHIGGDEVVKDYWRDCEYCQQLMTREKIADLDQLQAYFTNRTEKIINRHGKQIIGWDEILGGDINSSSTVMSWRGMEVGVSAAAMGHDVIMTPYSSVYFDFYQSTSRDEPMAIHGLTRLRDVYGFEPVPVDLDELQREKILGGQGNLWTEYVSDGDAVERMILPRMSALAEVLWSPLQGRSMGDFVTRLETFIAFLEQYNYQVALSHYKPEINAVLQADGVFEVTIDVDLGTIHYSLDGSLPDQQSPRYEQPLHLEHSATIRARAYHAQRGTWHGDSLLSVDKHKALGFDVEFANAADPQWNDRAEQTIVNGILGSDRIFHYEDWVALTGDDLDATIAFPQAVEVREVTIGVDAGLHRKLHKPTSFSVSSSADGESWQQLGSLSPDEISTGGNRLTIAFAPIKVKHLRVVAGNKGEVWSAEKEGMQPKTLFVDEIIVK